jgi:hypothetical protein
MPCSRAWHRGAGTGGPGVLSWDLQQTRDHTRLSAVGATKLFVFLVAKRDAPARRLPPRISIWEIKSAGTLKAVLSISNSVRCVAIAPCRNRGTLMLIAGCV